MDPRIQAIKYTKFKGEEDKQEKIKGSVLMSFSNVLNVGATKGVNG